MAEIGTFHNNVGKGSYTYYIHNLRRNSMLGYCNNHDDQYYGAI